MNKRSRRLIEQFEQAVRKHEMMGSILPEERPEIERQYKEAKLRLIYHVGFLEAVPAYLD